MIFFSSDSHFGHENIINYCNRPFKSVEEMDEALIQNWNKTVGKDDLIYHLGDFTLGGYEEANQIILRLNGRINFLFNRWHHDKRWMVPDPDIIPTYVSRSGHQVRFCDPILVLETELTHADAPIMLCHYPLAIWDRRHYGGWHLHGHSHNAYFSQGKILDVGVDSAAEKLGEYRPFSLDEVSEIMRGL